MGKYEDITIKKLVSNINERYFLPDIQREFVWDNDKTKFEDKIYDLFDSLLRDYPIGTFLFWEVKHNNLLKDNITVLKFLTNSDKENEIINTEQFLNKGCILVLDGQQRLTILNLSLKGVFGEKKNKKYLYFNLLSNPEEEKEVNERVYEFKLIDNEKLYFKEKDCIWWRVNQIMDKNFEVFSIVNQIAKENEINHSNKEYQLIGKNLQKLDTIFLKTEILSYYTIDEAKNDEEALEIFVRVNSGGVTLTYSDLLFSKIKQYWKKGSEKIDAREEFKDFLNKVNNERFEFDNDLILKTSLMLIDKDIKYQIKNFNKDNVELIKNNWENIKRSIKVVVDFLECINITSKKYLRSNNAIIPMIYYVYINKLKEIDNTSKDFDLMRKYIYTVLLNGVFGGQSDALLKDSREVIKEDNKLFPIDKLFKSFTKKNKIIRKGDELKDLLKDIRYGSDKSKLILSIIYGNGLLKDFQEDHMFPRSKMKKLFDKKIVDNISNIQALGASGNNRKNDKSFEDWLNEPKRSDDYMKIHLVPKMDYSEDKFIDFVEKRREIIFNKVSKFFE